MTSGALYECIAWALYKRFCDYCKKEAAKGNQWWSSHSSSKHEFWWQRQIMKIEARPFINVFNKLLYKLSLSKVNLNEKSLKTLLFIASLCLFYESMDHNVTYDMHRKWCWTVVGTSFQQAYDTCILWKNFAALHKDKLWNVVLLHRFDNKVCLNTLRDI